MIWLLILMFFILIFVGVPVSFSMALISILGLWYFDLPLMMVLQKMYAGNDSFPYLAVPLFIMAGLFMERGGISQRLVNLAMAMVGHLRGGLGQVVVVGEILFSGISGSSLADASAIGSIMLPALRRAGYKEEHSVSIICAATGMGILIPPCLLMVILGAIGNLSVAVLFFAGFLPGFIMAATLMLYIYYLARKGTLPGGETTFDLQRLGSASIHSIIPLMMPVIIFGGILGGIATATEVAVLAVIYGLIVGMIVYREFKLSELPKMFLEVATVIGSVGLLVGSTTIFSWIMAIQQVPEALSSLFLSISTEPYVFLLIVNLFFILATGLMDGLPALLIFYPILYPIAQKLGIHPVHFTICSVAATGIGLILPPIGIVLILLSSISETKSSAMFRCIIPYISVLIITFIIILFIPWVVLIIPKLLISGFL